MKRIDKKAQGLELSTIILIILGVAVLVFLIWGFSTGWSQLWQRLTGGTTGTNIETIRSACELACSTNGVAAYCSEQRTMTLGASFPAGLVARAEGDALNKDIKTRLTIDPVKNTTVGSCNALANEPKIVGLGFSACATVTCPSAA